MWERRGVLTMGSLLYRDRRCVFPFLVWIEVHRAMQHHWLLLTPPVAQYARPARFIVQAAGYDVVTMDTETGRKATRDALDEAARETGREPAVVQGNFDPRLLTDSSPMSAVNVSLLYIVSGRHSSLFYKQCQLRLSYCDTGRTDAFL